MMSCRVMFSEIVRPVELSALPIDVKLVLANAVPYPVEAHVDGLGSFLLYCVIGDAGGRGVVGSDWGGGLGMS